MLVWRIYGNEIGPNGNGAAHFTTKEEALTALQEFNSNNPNSCGSGPEKVSVESRKQLAAALNDAMGWGAS